MTNSVLIGEPVRNSGLLPVGNHSAQAAAIRDAVHTARTLNFTSVAPVSVTFSSNYLGPGADAPVVLAVVAERWMMILRPNAAGTSRVTLWSLWRRQCEVRCAPYQFAMASLAKIATAPGKERGMYAMCAVARGR